MGQVDWHQSRNWILLLCGNSGFFIFLAWIAYPESFKLLVGVMLAFTFISVGVGLFVSRWQQRKQAERLVKFLQEPSIENEHALIQVDGNKQWHLIGNELRQLQDALEEARLKSLDYETFIESWVHEIKTPLSLIHFVLQNRKDEMSPLVYQRLDHAKVSIHDHVERILFYAKLQATHVDYSLKPLSIEESIEDVLLDLASLLEEKQVQVQAAVEEIPIVCDERALQFILTQLLVNAVKYRNEQVESEIRLETGFHQAFERYYLKLADNGIGVLQSDLPFVFDKGFTGDVNNQKQSTGMGLFLVKKLCDDLRIDIEVESQRGEGLTIQLLFPKVNTDPAF